MITALCNIYIGSEEKSALFKETFPLVYKISDNWLVYIRGKYNKQVVAFIKKEFKDHVNNITFFNNLDDSNWAKSTKIMLGKSKYDYIHVFLEDHFLLKPINHFKKVVQSMQKNKIDYFQYSFFDIGFSKNSIEHLQPDIDNNFYSFDLKTQDISKFQKTNSAFYPFSLTAVCSKKYLINLLVIENKYLVHISKYIQALMENVYFFYPRNRAFWFKINQIVKYIGLRFVIYPAATPFNLEKSLFCCDKKLLPLRIGVLKEELFANWDDDNKLSNSSLIKRGLYPKYFRLQEKNNLELSDSKDYTLVKGEKSYHQYCPDIKRTTTIPKKYICVKVGELEISSDFETFVLKTGQSAWVVANIPHQYRAIKDSVYNYKII